MQRKPGLKEKGMGGKTSVFVVVEKYSAGG
jgi:hypothetical protein